MLLNRPIKYPRELMKQLAKPRISLKKNHQLIELELGLPSLMASTGKTLKPVRTQNPGKDMLL